MNEYKNREKRTLMCETESEREKKMRSGDSQPLPSAAAALSLTPESEENVSMLNNLYKRVNLSVVVQAYHCHCIDSRSLLSLFPDN